MAELGHVAVITTVHPALDGRIFHKEAMSLANGGYDVVLVAPDAGGVSEVVNAAGLDFHPLSGGTERRDRPRRWREVARFLWKTRRQFDVWHVHDPELLVLCAPLRLLFARQTRLVYDAHEDYAASVMSKGWLPSWARPVISTATRVVEKGLARTSQLVIGATPPISKLFQERPATKVVTVHNFPVASSSAVRDDDVPTAPPKRTGVTRCVYVGGLTLIRGVREMVAAMQQLQGEPIELVLAGPFESSTLRGEMLAAAPSGVNYLGTVPWQDVPAILGASDIGLLCLLPEPNYVNSLPTKLFEYFVAGLAVITSDFPAWSQFVTEAGVGMQVDPSDPAAIADAIRSLAADPARRADMGRRGQELARSTFTWERESAVLLDAYASMLASG